MTEKITRSLRETSWGRWVALILVSITMFFAYMFVDVLAPLKDLLETGKGWSSENFGSVAGSEFVLNVFVFFLIFAGIILDKIGIRRTALLAGFLMILGACIKLYGVSDWFLPTSGLYLALDGFSLFGLIDALPASATMACIGFAIFGCGVEMAGITVSKALVKWFGGKELALAMGLEMAIARLGVFAVFRLSPMLAAGQFITKPVAVCTLFLLIGFLTFLIYFFLDRKLDQQENIKLAPEDEFKVSDLKAIFTSKTFLIVAGLCVLYYSAIFPFQKFAADMLSSRLEIGSTDASKLFSFFPLGAMILTPLLGFFLDIKGKGATLLIIGAALMTCCHLIFALTPADMFTYPIAITAIVILGVSFSLVPAALWPSVPKLVNTKVLGSAYSIIFWIQNIGLMSVPIIIGASLDSTNPGVNQNLKTVKAEIDTLVQYQAEFSNELYKMDSSIYQYADNFETKEFEYQHKNAALVLYYSYDLNYKIEEAVKKLQLVYRKSEKRNAETQIISAGITDYLALNEAWERIKLEGYNQNSESATYKTKETGTETQYFVKTELIDKISPEAAVLLAKIDEKAKAVQAVEGDTIYNYKVPMLIFACFGIMALLLGFWLKVEDRKKGYGLELPNKKK